jgi:hypothetical protein
MLYKKKISNLYIMISDEEYYNQCLECIKVVIDKRINECKNKIYQCPCSEYVELKDREKHEKTKEHLKNIFSEN